MTTYKDGLRAIIERAMWASGPIIEALNDIERLEVQNAKLLQKRKELESQLAAANKRADAAVEEICLKCHTRAAEFNLEVKPEHCAQCKWRGGKGEKG